MFFNTTSIIIFTHKIMIPRVATCVLCKSAPFARLLFCYLGECLHAPPGLGTAHQRNKTVFQSNAVRIRFLYSFWDSATIPVIDISFWRSFLTFSTMGPVVLESLNRLNGKHHTIAHGLSAWFLFDNIHFIER